MLGLGIKRNTTYNYCAAYGLFTQTIKPDACYPG